MVFGRSDETTRLAEAATTLLPPRRMGECVHEVKIEGSSKINNFAFNRTLSGSAAGFENIGLWCAAISRYARIKMNL